MRRCTKSRPLFADRRFDKTAYYIAPYAKHSSQPHFDRFISLVEILAMKSVAEAAGYPANEALKYSVLVFFAGSLLTHILDVVRLDVVLCIKALREVGERRWAAGAEERSTERRSGLRANEFGEWTFF